MTNITKDTGAQLLIPALGVLLTGLLVYMVWIIAQDNTQEGFTNRKSKLKGKKKVSKFQNINSKSSKKKSKPNPSDSKLKILKNGKYNPNEELINYGMDGDDKDITTDDDEEEDTPTDKYIDKLGKDAGKSTLKKLVKKGKRDNFKNVINEVDNINPAAFKFNNIGSTISRYNENFNNRLNEAKAKNKGDNLEATLAQGSVIFDEFKKIFLFTDMF